MAESGKSDEATALLHRALAIAPDTHSIRLRLSQLYHQQGQFALALSLLREVPADLRRSFDSRAREAALLGTLGRRDEEVAVYRELIRERPRNAHLWMSLGNALNYAGRPPEAVRALRRAIRIRDDFGEPWWSLANLKSFRFGDRDVAAMSRAVRGALSPIDTLHFHFALGRAFEDRGDYERSFNHYASGNRLRAASLDPAQMRATLFVDAAIATFTGDFFERNKGCGEASAGPIFVLGLQRSGSTLIEQILASHPDIEATGELLTMQHLWDEVAKLGARDNRNIFEQIAVAGCAVFRRVGEQYLARTRAFRLHGTPLFIDKQPANWMNVGLIRLALPNARIVDARRHPLACGFSNFKQHYASGVTFSYSLEAIGRFYADYLRLMRHFDRVQPGAVHHVLNEDLIEDPEREIRRLLDYVGVPFDPACLEFHRGNRAVHTPSAEQVRRPINRDGLDHWRHYEAWLSPLKRALGPALRHWRD